MTQTDESLQLPFSAPKQDAVLGHLLTDPQFFMQARYKIEPKWFQDPICAKIWTQKQKFYTEFQRIPTIEELREWGEFITEEPLVRNKMQQKVKITLLEAKNYGKDVVSKELQVWLQAVLFQTAASNAKELYVSSKFDDCFHIFSKALEEIKTTRFVEDKEASYENYLSDFQQELLDRDNALTFGAEVVDRILLPENDGNGCLLPGDQTVLMASQNMGKTTVMLSVIAANIKRGKSVFFMSHEGRLNDLKMKLWCNMLNVSRSELFRLLPTPEGKARFNKALEIIKKYLVHVHYMKAGMAVEDIEPIIRTKQEERKAKTGKGFDLFCDDYPAKLKMRSSRGNDMKRNVLGEIYDYFVNFAGEYQWHSIVNYQGNRESAKISKGLVGNGRLLTSEDASESYEPTMTATNVITINRDPSAKALDIIIFNIDKSRSSETNIAVACKSNFKHAISHSQELGGVAYRDTDSDVDKALHFMQKYPNQFITDQAMLEYNATGTDSLDMTA